MSRGRLGERQSVHQKAIQEEEGRGGGGGNERSHDLSNVNTSGQHKPHAAAAAQMKTRGVAREANDMNDMNDTNEMNDDTNGTNDTNDTNDTSDTLTTRQTSLTDERRSRKKKSVPKRGTDGTDDKDDTVGDSDDGGSGGERLARGKHARPFAVDHDVALDVGASENRNLPDKRLGKKRRTRRNRHNAYSVFIYKVLRQVHPDVGISKRAMSIMNSFVFDMFDRIATEAANLSRSTKRHAITHRDIEAAVRMTLRGELAMHAVSEGTKAVLRYNAFLSNAGGQADLKSDADISRAAQDADASSSEPDVTRLQPAP